MRRDGPPDKRLFRRARHGDRQAFIVLLRRYDPRLRRLVLRLVADATRVDVVLSRAYLRAWRSLPHVEPPESVAEWIYRIVYNACVNEVRWAPARPMSNPPEGPWVPLPLASPSRRLAGLRALSPEDRVALVLVDGEGFSLEAAANILKRPEVDIAADVMRARQLWRRLVVGDPEPRADRPTVELAPPAAEVEAREAETAAAARAAAANGDRRGHVKVVDPDTTTAANRPHPDAADPVDEQEPSPVAGPTTISAPDTEPSVHETPSAGPVSDAGQDHRPAQDGGGTGRSEPAGDADPVPAGDGTPLAEGSACGEAPQASTGERAGSAGAPDGKAADLDDPAVARTAGGPAVGDVVEGEGAGGEPEAGATAQQATVRERPSGQPQRAGRRWRFSRKAKSAKPAAGAVAGAAREEVVGDEPPAAGDSGAETAAPPGVTAGDVAVAGPQPGPVEGEASAGTGGGSGEAGAGGGPELAADPDAGADAEAAQGDVAVHEDGASDAVVAEAEVAGDGSGETPGDAAGARQPAAGGRSARERRAKPSSGRAKPPAETVPEAASSPGEDGGEVVLAATPVVPGDPDGDSPAEESTEASEPPPVGPGPVFVVPVPVAPEATDVSEAAAEVDPGSGTAPAEPADDDTAPERRRATSGGGAGARRKRRRDVKRDPRTRGRGAAGGTEGGKTDHAGDGQSRGDGPRETS